MTRITHHLTDALIMGYSAGTLPEAVNLIVATHVSLCDDCRAQLESYEALGGAVLEDMTGSDLDEGSLDATLRLIASGAAEPAQDAPRRRTGGVLPAPLVDYVGGGLESVSWKAMGMGVRQAILPTSRDATARLLFIPAGTAMPDHGHKGMEITLVLKGAFLDGPDRFARGDVEIADQTLHHTPVADIGEDCICLAVTDAPLRFNRLLPRLAQPFFRI